MVGQEPITKTLSNAIKSGKLSHAYLFTGPRGVGKTTVARILAHEVNKLPYTDESIHLDIIEIDGASSRRIEEVRDLREKVHIAPSSAKYKVYIIDEVHMLTREAFNALLKTLEEPPAHCIFILATTEVHKLPETIISRTQHFTFAPIGTKNTVDHLETLAKKEKIDITPEALQLLADFSTGSFRDSINLLDQLSSSKEVINVTDVSDLVGLPPENLITDLLSAIEQASPQKSLELLIELQYQGISPSNVAATLSKRLRDKILASSSSENAWISPLLKGLLEVSASKQPQDVLEIVILEVATRAGKHPPKITDSAVEDQPASINKTTEPKVATNDQIVATSVLETKPQIITGSFDLSQWDEVLKLVKDQAGSLYTALRLANPSLDGNELDLHFQFGLHQKKVNESTNTALIEQLIKDFSGSKVRIKCILDKTVKKLGQKTTIDQELHLDSSQNESLKTISNIFGQTEMLES